MSLQTEIAPQSYQAKIAQEHRDRRLKWAARAVTDIGIDLRRHRVVKSVEVTNNASVTSYWPPVFWDTPSPWNLSIPIFNGDSSVQGIPIGDTIYTIREIQAEVCMAAKVSMNDLISPRRTWNLVRPRQLAMALARALTRRSMPEIGRCFGGRDHTTILHGCRKMEQVIFEVSWCFPNKGLQDIIRISLEACTRIYPPTPPSRYGARH